MEACLHRSSSTMRMHQTSPFHWRRRCVRLVLALRRCMHQNRRMHETWRIQQRHRHRFIDQDRLLWGLARAFRPTTQGAA